MSGSAAKHCLCDRAGHSANVCWPILVRIACEAAVALQADETHCLMNALVSKRMAVLLRLFMPQLDNATVRTAVNHLAVGMSGFKAGDPEKPEEAASVLPLVYIFITAVLPHCNAAFASASSDQAGMAGCGVAGTEAVCDVLMLAIKTFESAVEVTLRCKVQEASELFR